MFKQSVTVKNLDRRVKILSKRPETKHVSNVESFVDIPLGVSFVLLNGMIHGDAWGTRDGNQVKMVNIQYKLKLFNDTILTTSTRTMLLVAKNPRSTIPQIGEILSDTSNNTALILSQYVKGKAFKNNFRILYDRVHVLSGFEDGNNTKFVKVNKLLGEKTAYIQGQNNGDITDIENNAVYSIIISDVNTGDTKRSLFVDIGYLDE